MNFKCHKFQSRCHEWKSLYKLRDQKNQFRAHVSIIIDTASNCSLHSHQHEALPKNQCGAIVNGTVKEGSRSVNLAGINSLHTSLMSMCPMSLPLCQMEHL